MNLYSKEPVARLGLRLLRASERALPPIALFVVVWPVVALATFFQLYFRKPRFRDFQELPVTLRPATAQIRWMVRIWRRRIRLNLTKLLCLWPDRLELRRWRRRGRVHGAEEWDRACKSGRPIVLAILHFGPVSVLRYWLRARGHRACTLGVRPPSTRSGLRRLLDQWSDSATGLHQVPHLIDPRHVRQARDMLSRRHILIVAVDGYRGRQVNIDSDDFCFGIASGAVRLARSANALLLPCAISADRALGFTVHFGNPLPEDLVLHRMDETAACRWLLEQLMPLTCSEIEQCTYELLRHFRPCELADKQTANEMAIRTG
jgi:lauroyl/myristoyl acyltransferase